MITIAGSPVDPSELLGAWSLSGGQREVVTAMARSRDVYAYPSAQVLRFELKLRERLVKSAVALAHSGLAFATFERTRCNEEFWIKTEYGGCLLRENVPPSVAIEDIFRRGRAYALECATAMVVIIYYAVLQSIRRSDFDRLFSGLLLYDWRYDQDLRLTTVRTRSFLPGDIVYFENPDFDPSTPEWQGENAVVLGGGEYYGHGIGIGPAEMFIRHLNRQRRPGATRSAFLSDLVTRPGFAYLSQFEGSSFAQASHAEPLPAWELVIARIGSSFWEV